jgi:hypothetical protein
VFGNATFVFDLHFCHKLLLFFRIGRSHSGIESLDPGSIGRKRSWRILSHGKFIKPSCKILFAKFVDVCVAVNFYVVACLGDVNTIKNVKEALSFQRNRQLVVNQAK